MLELRPRVGDVREVKSLRLQTFPAGYEAMGSDESRWKPETRESADHSLPFVMAMALMEGGLEVRHYDEELYLRPEVRELMAKMSVGVGEEPSRMWPDMPLNIVEIEMNSGGDLLDEGGVPPGALQAFHERGGPGAQVPADGGGNGQAAGGAGGPPAGPAAAPGGGGGDRRGAIVDGRWRSLTRRPCGGGLRGGGRVHCYDTS